MTAISSTKSLKASVASAVVLGALAVTPAFAQTNTSGSYIPTNADQAGVAIAAAPGNTQSLATFQAAITSAFSANTGGDINFDNLTATTGLFAASFGTNTPFTTAYGTSGASTLSIAPNATTPWSFNNNAGTNATSGSVYLGTSGTGSPVTFSFSQNLSNFGVVVINRAATRTITMTVNLSNGTSVTPDTNVVTSATAPSFFQYQPASGLSISSVVFTNLENTATAAAFERFDDLGFVVAPAAAPEPSQFAGLGLGALGLGLLALKARKRSALGN